METIKKIAQAGYQRHCARKWFIWPPAGTVFVGLASANGVKAIPLQLEGDRQEVRRRTVEQALLAVLAQVGQG